MSAAQLPLFGAQSVHLGHRGPVTGNLECVICRVSLALADDLTCGTCPGLVEPAPWWMVLPSAAALEEAAAELEEAAA